MFRFLAKQRLLLVTVVLSVMGVLAGCQASSLAEPAAVEVTPIVTTVALIEEATATVAPTATPEPTATATPEMVIEEETLAVIEVMPTAVVGNSVAAPAGLIFYTMDPWVFGKTAETAGEYTILADGALLQTVLSPSGQKMFYRSSAGLFHVKDLITGEVKQLTNGNVVIDMPSFHQWMGEDQLLIGVWVNLDEQGPNDGRLAIYDLSTDKILFITDELTGSRAAVSPDGSTIAFASEWGYVYDVDTATITRFDPTVFAGWDYGTEVRLGNPSWSVEGDKIVWVAGGMFDGKWQIGTAVFDLTTQTSKLMHTYEPVGRGGWPGPALFSPDGQWVTVEEWPTDMTQSGVWLHNLETAESVHIAQNTAFPMWSIDGTALYFAEYDAEGYRPPVMLNLTNWERQSIEGLPNGAILVGFAESHPQLP